MPTEFDLTKRMTSKIQRSFAEYLELLDESGVSTKGIRNAIEKLQG